MPIIIKDLSAPDVDESLVALFAVYGEIDITQRDQNVGVKLKNGDSAAEQRAVNDLQNTELQGQPLQLKWVKYFEDLGFPISGDRSSGGKSPEPTESSIAGVIEEFD